ncbi:MAG: type II secretory pathway component PulK [Myxococcota bacterium]|jgi:type II secretory pathway component PulK
MAPVRWLWHEFTRPRGPVRHGFYRVGRSSRAGVALLMVVSSIMLLTVIVTEIAYSATVRISLAAHHRDEAKAEALAMSGVQMYRLILMGSQALGRNPMIQQFGAMMGVNGDSLWQMLPRFNTGLLRMAFVSGGDMDDDDAAEITDRGGLSEEEIAESREAKSAQRRNFLDFDGDFSASVKDENRFIFVGNLAAQDLAGLLQLPAAQQLQGLMRKEEFNEYFNDNNLDRVELIANLVDWTDPDSTRLYRGGQEESLYDNLDSPYRPKNAPFDTKEEIRLVDGWHLDGTWERFGRHLTIYGNGKINVNTAPRQVLRGLLTAYQDGTYGDSMIETWLDVLLEQRGMPLSMGGVYFNDPNGFVQFMENTIGMPLRDEITESIQSQSETFRVVSTGEVGDARVEILTVIDFSNNNKLGRILHYRIR